MDLVVSPVGNLGWGLILGCLADEKVVLYLQECSSQVPEAALVGGLCLAGLSCAPGGCLEVWHNHVAPFLLFRAGEPSTIARMSQARPAGLRSTFMDRCSGWTKF